ncbi:MAG: phenylalanine--tRNA ligase subunit alpha [Candidatus Omnitrophota bacterium]|nr:MAG: phenylalanine--tRNA ligase subunit alpha [Candidatus Omnitrophota bacterium]
MKIEDLQSIFQEFQEKINQISDLKLLEELKTFYLGRKGKIAELIKQIPLLSPEERPVFGKEINVLKQKLQDLFTRKKEELEEKVSEGAKLDPTLPGIRFNLGSIHPITTVIEEICQIFEHIGFTVVEGPEIETDYYNFQALNIPPGHPARDDFATFYLPCDNYLLRSQTSTVQIRIMEKVKPPLRVIAPGKVFRPDNLDASHSFMFHQIEGLVVDEETNFSHLKGTLSYFVRKFFGPETKMRFRPHFFPFTEPSAEVDISCIICGGKGCSVCGRKGWLEILGSGLVHPNVLKEVGLDPGIYQGYAFGMGIERIAMLKYGIDDIRVFFNNDIRFLEQFK